MLVLAAKDAALIAPGVFPSPPAESAAVAVRAALLPPRYCSEPAGVSPLPRLRLAEVRGSNRRLIMGPWAPEVAVVEAKPPPLLTPLPPAPPEPSNCDWDPKLLSSSLVKSWSGRNCCLSGQSGCLSPHRSLLLIVGQTFENFNCLQQYKDKCQYYTT